MKKYPVADSDQHHPRHHRYSKFSCNGKSGASLLEPPGRFGVLRRSSLYSIEPLMTRRKNSIPILSCCLMACLIPYLHVTAQRVGPGVGAGTLDPAAIFRAAALAVRVVRSLRYEARYEGEGAFATRSPVAQGEVLMTRLAPGDPLKAKMAARGRYFTGAGEGEAQPFLVAFDGKKITRLRPKERTV